MKLHTWLAILVYITITSSLFGATVKTKKGEIIKGDIAGKIVLKANVISNEEGRYKYRIGYIVLNGKDIQTIDEKGVTVIDSVEFPVVFYYYSYETPPSDTRLLGIAHFFLEFALNSTVGFNVNLDDGTLSIKSMMGSHLTDRLIGELKKEEDGVQILSNITITTEKGVVLVHIDGIVEPTKKLNKKKNKN
ncbi:MAG: hypothetical protein A2315_09365 [Ignavibacteria bacterium RIFOXYB2_FULL_35_12]|nr:MAG: hypothetical protein A2058_04120 [Ignavibacteria bacterium GWA2_36_19]OGU55215.1 MAG: hypothetical protein A2006_04565 [Ignavibacteria bacterium GWC2_35_8]OGU62497.1 MAG: hypothetical protein A2X60_17890 [Ignavibacteria bacterium GWF2_35_20]OGU81730.1 MAG: hypothetical protein A2254_11310 [Ignavibacteria bacterium RIFOXYA2_FULL_35_9]OGU86678.1 MAG: hypothetical protein A3K31_05580 [Ignavibacteria bacterium RIFOXYA12_FULL_35_25]OGU87985.1 MAG: hypothetical protein A2492_13445 [Ignavibac